jgi:hypothetical protein
VRSPSSSALRLRAVPWAMLARAVMVVGEHWSALSAKDRSRLARLLRESGGRLGNLSAKQRDELRRLVRKLDLKGAGRELVPLLRGGTRRRKRR